MPEHTFTLILNTDPEPLIEELFEAGCDDATFGAIDGAGFADFDREAPTFTAALESAIKAVDSVGLSVVRVEPDDLVTATEIAKHLNRSREYVRLLVAGERGPGDFPAPVSHAKDRFRLWRLSDVLAWNHERDEADLLRAQCIAAVNAALELRRRLPVLGLEMQELSLGLLSSGPVERVELEIEEITEPKTVTAMVIKGSSFEGKVFTTKGLAGRFMSADTKSGKLSQRKRKISSRGRSSK